MNLAEISSKKFVWSYLLKNGYETDGKYSYYAGRYGCADPKLKYSFSEKIEAAHAKTLDHIAKVGIDWESTEDPTSSEQSSFEGTFCESSTAEWLLGTLVLKNGDRHQFAANDEDGFGSYLANIVKHMRDLAELDAFSKRFG